MEHAAADDRVALPAKERFSTAVDGEHRAVLIDAQERLGRMLEDGGQRGVALAGQQPLALGLDVGADRGGQCVQRLSLVLADLARLWIDDAERADGVTVGGPHWRAGVEADAAAEHERVVGKARVGGGVGHDPRLGLGGDGVRAEGDVARILVAVAQADAGLDPLTVGVDQAHGGQRRPDQACGELCVRAS